VVLTVCIVLVERATASRCFHRYHSICSQEIDCVRSAQQRVQEKDPCGPRQEHVWDRQQTEKTRRIVQGDVFAVELMGSTDVHPFRCLQSGTD